MSNFVDIYHNDTHPFRGFIPGDVLKYQYEYPFGDEGKSLNDVWRENNVVDGWEYPVAHKTRSLSVGDGFAITTNYVTEFYVVGIAGHQRVTSREFYQGVEALAQETLDARKDAPTFEAIGFVNISVEG